MKKNLKNSPQELLHILQKICGKKKTFLHEPYFTNKELIHLKNCINSTFVSTKSNLVPKFEKMISKYTKSKYAIATVNGTSALHMSLLSINTNSKNEVLIPSFNFVASANAISYLGATPHFVEIEERTLSIDPNKLEIYINKAFVIKNGKCVNKKTNKIVNSMIVPHLFGHPARIDRLCEVAKKYKINVIEDAAESLGSFYKKKHTGTFGLIGILSFNGNKTITTGGGGAILTNNKKLEKKIRQLIEVSKIKHDWKFMYSGVGYNLKMPGINAALGCAQILNLEKIVRKKRRLYLKYNKYFKNSKNFKLLKEPPFCRSNYWLQNVYINKTKKNLRDKIIKYTNQKGFQTRPAWTLLHNLKHFEKCPKSELNLSNKLFYKLISLPSSPKLSK